MASNTLLDVDDTILTNNLLLPGNNNERGIDDMLEEFETKSKCLTIHPSPGVCMKVKLDTGEKVFLNICTSTKIPPLENMTEEKLLSILAKETFDFSIPMSIGEERLEVDNGGTPCITHDVIINKDYFEKCQIKHTIWIFILTAILEAVSRKFNRSFDITTCTILKNRKVMGTLRPQHIQDREPQNVSSQPPKPLIQEVPSSSKTVSHNSTTSAQSKNNYEETNTCNYVILKEPSEGVTNRLIGLFQIPKGVRYAFINFGISSKNLIVLVHPIRLVITTNENEFAYDICVPYIMKTDEVESFFDQDLGVLRLNMPVNKK